MWSGPEAETMCSVPPETGFPELAVDGDDDDDVDDELHAASAEAARAAAASPAKNLGALIMGMSSWVRKLSRARTPSGAPAPLITTYQERLFVSGAEIQTIALVVARL
jgi:hypothetical protein